METDQKIVPVPTMLTADSDVDSVASELTDPHQASWSESLARATSNWNPCSNSAGGKGTTKPEAYDTASETESDYNTETSGYDTETESSCSSSSESSDSDKHRPPQQVKQKKQTVHKTIEDNMEDDEEVEKEEYDDADDADDNEIDAVGAIVDFLRSFIDSGPLIDSEGVEESDGWAHSLSIFSASDETLLDRHIVLNNEKKPEVGPVILRHPKQGLLKNEHQVQNGLHLVSEDYGDTYHDHVVVATEALAFSDFEADAKSIPFVVCNNFVGIVSHVGPEAKELGLRTGMRVASINRCDYNSRYVSMPVDHLYVVPKSLDAAETAALFSCYLPAFQALHHGKSRPSRYSRSCLKGRKILVTGGNRLEAQAVLRLARLAGATDLYVTAPIDYHPILADIDGVTLLEDFPEDEWLSAVQGNMDLVVDYEFPFSLDTVSQALSPKGRLICIPAKKRPWLVSLYEQYKLSSVKRASLFDFSETLKTDLAEAHQDIKFLLSQLSKRQVRPTIDRFVKLSDVPTIYDKLQGCPLSGSVVCEPQKE